MPTKSTKRKSTVESEDSPIKTKTIEQKVKKIKLNENLDINEAEINQTDKKSDIQEDKNDSIIKENIRPKRAVTRATKKAKEEKNQSPKDQNFSTEDTLDIKLEDKKQSLKDLPENETEDKPEKDTEQGENATPAESTEKIEENIKISNDPKMKQIHRLLSWNVNGARAVIKKEPSLQWLIKQSKNPEVQLISFQETKCDGSTYPPMLDPLCPKSYKLKFKKKFLNSSTTKKGYSGTCILSKEAPESKQFGMGFQPADCEGRVICLEYEKYYFITAYVPNSGAGLVRLKERTEKFEPKMREYLKKLDKKKPVIYAGDLNVACSKIELANPKSNYNKTSGFTQAEIDQFFIMIEECNFVDSFRHFYPDKTGCYTYWGYRGNARPRNVGWRLDYFIVSERLVPFIEDVVHHTDVHGSDHCPIELILNVADMD